MTAEIVRKTADDFSGVSSAIFSPCMRYRYTLERAWASLPRYVLWIMLNPSTANSTTNDATVRRCIGYAKAWGYTGILVGNLYAWRSTSPRALFDVRGSEEQIGPENERHLRGLLRRASLVVCAWGQSGPTTLAKLYAMNLCREGGQFRALHCLKLNNNCEPSHPLRLSKKLQPMRYLPFVDDGPGAGG